MKTDKEKMLEGLPYIAESLANERLHAKKLIFEYNNLHPQEIVQSCHIIKTLFGSVGKHYFIEPPFHCDYGYNISIGENFYSNYNLVILDCAKVTIGDDVLIAPNVSIYTAGHPVHSEIRKLGYEYAFPITIGNNVWIGGSVSILPGVTIGDNSVIGAGSIVTHDIPANVIAVGNPCHVLRAITDEDKKYYYKNRPFKEDML